MRVRTGLHRQLDADKKAKKTKAGWAESILSNTSSSAGCSSPIRKERQVTFFHIKVTWSLKSDFSAAKILSLINIPWAITCKKRIAAQQGTPAEKGERVKENQVHPVMRWRLWEEKTQSAYWVKGSGKTVKKDEGRNSHCSERKMIDTKVGCLRVLVSVHYICDFLCACLHFSINIYFGGESKADIIGPVFSTCNWLYTFQDFPHMISELAAFQWAHLHWPKQPRRSTT